MQLLSSPHGRAAAGAAVVPDTGVCTAITYRLKGECGQAWAMHVPKGSWRRKPTSAATAAVGFAVPSSPTLLPEHQHGQSSVTFPEAKRLPGFVGDDPRSSRCSCPTAAQVPPWCLAEGRRAKLCLSSGPSLSVFPLPGSWVWDSLTNSHVGTKD